MLLYFSSYVAVYYVIMLLCLLCYYVIMFIMLLCFSSYVAAVYYVIMLLCFSSYVTGLVYSSGYGLVLVQITLILLNSVIQYPFLSKMLVDGNVKEKNNIKDHIASIHIETGPHPCNECGLICKSWDSLRLHHYRNHRS